MPVPQPKPWNHNLQYQPLVLAKMPQPCGRALDVGCGDGRLTRRMSHRSGETIGIDADAAIIQAASKGTTDEPVTFLTGDFLTMPLPQVDFLSMVATLHHLPLGSALTRCIELLRPGGVLVIVGLYRPVSPLDHAWATAGFTASHVLRRLRTVEHQQAPMQMPRQTLREVRAAADVSLPKHTFKRLLLFRYLLLWSKPLT